MVKILKNWAYPMFQLQIQDWQQVEYQAEFYDHPSKKMKIIGITGTNGKTTTASLISSILIEAGHKVAQIGTLGRPQKDLKKEDPYNSRARGAAQNI